VWPLIFLKTSNIRAYMHSLFIVRSLEVFRSLNNQFLTGFLLNVQGEPCGPPQNRYAKKLKLNFKNSDAT
jgi:hypothetical protein